MPRLFRWLLRSIEDLGQSRCFLIGVLILDSFGLYMLVWCVTMSVTPDARSEDYCFNTYLLCDWHREMGRCPGCMAGPGEGQWCTFVVASGYPPDRRLWCQMPIVAGTPEKSARRIRGMTHPRCTDEMPLDCQGCDRDGDGDVDLKDYARLQRANPAKPRWLGG
jgi:hypothetical protein